MTTRPHDHKEKGITKLVISKIVRASRWKQWKPLKALQRSCQALWSTVRFLPETGDEDHFPKKLKQHLDVCLNFQMFPIWQLVTKMCSSDIWIHRRTSTIKNLIFFYTKTLLGLHVACRMRCQCRSRAVCVCARVRAHVRVKWPFVR